MPRGPAGANPVRRVHWMHGVHCGMPRGERTAALARATQVAHLRRPACRSCCGSMVASRTQTAGNRRGAGACVFGIYRRGARYRPLADQHPARNLHAARAQCGQLRSLNLATAAVVKQRVQSGLVFQYDLPCVHLEEALGL